MKLRGEANIWLYHATCGIRFAEDRDAVRQELREHLEDEIAAVQEETGYSQEAAEKIVVQRMGDADEIGERLVAVHTPWMGFLWRLSKVLLALVCVLVIFSVIRERTNNWAYNFELFSTDSISEVRSVTLDERKGLTGADLFNAGRDADQLAQFTIGQQLRAGTQTVEVLDCTIWRTAEDHTDLFLHIRLEDHRFWEMGQLMGDLFTITDSSGNHCSRCIALEGGFGFYHSEYLIQALDFDPTSDFVQISYGPNGSIFSLRAEIPEHKWETGSIHP